MKLCSIVLLVILAGVLNAQREDRLLYNISAEKSEECVKAAAVGCDFEKWKMKFNVSYSTDQSDYLHHLQYCKNCLIFNNPQGNYTMKERETAAMTEQEFNQYLGLFRTRRNSNLVGSNNLQNSFENLKLGAVSSIPSNLDYRNYNGKNYVSRIKDQGSCGSCWAFAANALYQSQLLIAGHTFNLSDESVLECTSQHYSFLYYSTCSGGITIDALYYLAKKGNALSQEYPYTSYQYQGFGYYITPGICQARHRIYLGEGQVYAYYGQESMSANSLKSYLIQYGPLAIGIYVNNAFYTYSSGVFNGCPSDSYLKINHAVLLIGWDSNDNWIIKNQWGTDWGQGGFMTISKANDCGLSNDIATIYIANPLSEVELLLELIINFENYHLFGFCLWVIVLACML